MQGSLTILTTPQRSLTSAKLFARARPASCQRWASSRTPDFAAIDAKWRPRWKNASQWNRTAAGSKGKYYVLPMFPYPSGALHIGHLRNYTISDVIARYRRMSGHDVLHPIGWDAFGLPAENAAMERGIDPAHWTLANIETMRGQIEAMGGCWDWDSEITTCDPDFYKKTQRIFLQLYEHGLAYRGEAVVNYDPIDRTVLANEQVDSHGHSWRSGAKVEQIKLKQWFFKITEMAPQLLEDLKLLEKDGDWPLRVVAMQRNWLGKSEGATLSFRILPMQDDPSNWTETHVDVFTTRPDTLFGVQYIALSLDHPIVQERAPLGSQLRAFIDTARDLQPDTKAGFKIPGIFAENPIRLVCSKDKDSYFSVPVFAAPYVKSEYANGAVMGVPAHDERDFSFWEQNGPVGSIPRSVIHKFNRDEKVFSGGNSGYQKCFSGLGLLSNDCQQYSGLSSTQASQHILDDLIRNDSNRAKKSTQWRLRDWLISRQRYWGTPIPVIHCKNCGEVPVPSQHLPVKLPTLEGILWKEQKGNPLEQQDEWLSTPCPKCGESARRETDTMDTFVDSSWYFREFAEPKERDYGKNKYMPVDLYVGGVEHAILHLLYARFISKFLSSVDAEQQGPHEPFTKLLTQGMVHGRTFSDPVSGKFLRPEEIDFSNTVEPKVLANGGHVTVSYEKMSKSKYNGVDPLECIHLHGADVTRAHLLFQAPVSEVLEWDEQKIVGVQRWLGRVWSMTQEMADDPFTGNLNDPVIPTSAIRNLNTGHELWTMVQKTIDSVTQSYSKTHSLNTVVSDLMRLTNSIQEAFTSRITRDNEIGRRIVRLAQLTLLRLMTPITPSFAEECWAMLHQLDGQTEFAPERTASCAGFPERDDSLPSFHSQSQACAVQINGKFKFAAKIATPSGELNGEALKHWVLRRVLESPEGAAAFRKFGWNVQQTKKIFVVRNGRVLNLVF